MAKFFDVPIDTETFYCTKSGYTLSKMTAEEYIRDPRFQIIGLALRWPGQPTRWLTNMTHAEMGAVLRRHDWSDKIVIGHNLSEFDALILTEVLGVRPRFYQCTLALARQLHGSETGKSLGKLCELYGLPPKGDEVIRADGMRLEDFSPQQLAAYGDYCINDTDRCYDLYNIFKRKLPPQELQYAHLLARMWAEPRIELDLDLLRRLSTDLAARKMATLQRVCQLLDIPYDQAQDTLRSDAKFADALRQLGIDPPRKISKRTGKEAYAFAKTDRAMEELLEHEDDEVQALITARLGVKTTIMESRVERFTGIAERGKLPAPIAYGKTVTARAAGCLVAASKITCYDSRRGVCEKNIVDVLLTDLVWDGEAFVQHEGVQFSGYREVIEHDGVTGTGCHPVFTIEGSNATVSLAEAKRTGARIVAPRAPEVGRDYGNRYGDEAGA